MENSRYKTMNKTLPCLFERSETAIPKYTRKIINSQSLTSVNKKRKNSVSRSTLFQQSFSQYKIPTSNNITCSITLDHDHPRSKKISKYITYTTRKNHDQSYIENDGDDSSS